MGVTELVMSAADWETNGEQVNTIPNTSPILQSKVRVKMRISVTISPIAPLAWSR